jgi:inorganic pyrophosphatase
MTDSGEGDDKILAVPSTDPRFKNMTDLSTFPDHFVKEVKHFMETYKIIQNKLVTIDAILDVDDAKKVIEKSIQDFKNLK